jgi:inner membrane protein
VDSLTQIVLGGAVSAAIAPARHRRAALLAGAALGTLPDLDSFLIQPFTDNPVTLMTVHRSFSHSLLVLPVVGWLHWWLFKRRGGRVADSPMRWFWAMQAALLTHPLLDAFTVYGTQLWWPLPMQPTSWSTVFIIDPGYTLWLLIAGIFAWWAAERTSAQRALVGGLVLSSAYLGGSVVAKQLVDRDAAQALAAMGLANAPRLSTPMPLNTLLWRVIVMTPDGYLEGQRSLVADTGPMTFQRFDSDKAALDAARDVPAVQRLQWFNGGFMRAQTTADGTLVLSDLRMGAAPSYSFQFEVARRVDNDAWQAVPPKQLEWRVPTGDFGALWDRIWNMPPAGTGPSTR